MAAQPTSGSQQELSTFATKLQMMVDTATGQISTLEGAKQDFATHVKSQTGVAVQTSLQNGIDKSKNLKTKMENVIDALQRGGAKIAQRDVEGKASIAKAGNMDGLNLSF